MHARSCTHRHTDTDTDTDTDTHTDTHTHTDPHTHTHTHTHTANFRQDCFFSFQNCSGEAIFLVKTFLGSTTMISQ